MKKKKQRQYENKRNTILEMNYEKTLKDVYKQLDREYKSVLREIDNELLKWESKRASGTMPNTFGYSEEKSLRESKKAIELLINELAENEYKLLDRAMDKLYAKDLLDMNKLEIEYLQYRDDLEIEYMADYMRRNPMSKASLGTDAFSNGVIWGTHSLTDTTGAVMSAINIKTNNIMWIEQMLRQPIPTNMLSKDIWYKGCQGKTFGERIAIRTVQLKSEINQAINSMYAQGKGYEYATKRIAERVGVSNSHAKRLVQTECRLAEVQANTKHYKDMGVKYFARKTVNDSRVCDLCKKHKNDVYTSEELERNPWVGILHVGDRCIIEPLSSIRGEEAYRNRSNQ